MEKYVNLNKKKLIKRVEEFIAQYTEHDVGLKLNSNDIYNMKS